MKRRLRPIVATLAAALAVMLALAACSPLGVVNALVPADTYVSTEGVAYGPLPRHKLDVYTPVSAAPKAGWPVVVFFYGGNWTSGERADYKFVGEALAGRGVLALVADYRLYPEAAYPGFLEDSAQAVGYAIEHARSLGGDQKRVFVMGHSAGGYNAAMLALDERWLRAVGHDPKELRGWLGLAGAYDFFPLEPGQPARPVFHHPDYPAHAQPIEDVTPTSLRAFLGAPVNDRVVNPERSTMAMAAKLKAAGVPVELHRYEGVSHSLLIGSFARPLRGRSTALADAVAWINAS
ncbi:MAG: alpha/beta hydrolase [Pseudomonadota bacterium]|nr:alpha/beta hydrolase [Pseudomonadota bacterium]